MKSKEGAARPHSRHATATGQQPKKGEKLVGLDGRFKRDPEAIGPPDKAKFIRASDLVPMAKEVGYERR